MTHFSVIVCLDDKDGLLARAAVVEKDFPGAIRSAVESRLETVLAPWDENSEVTPYRSYEDGGPEDYYLYRMLKQASEDERNGTGILPYEPDAIGWSSNSSKSTPGEQRVEIARKAALFRSLPEPVTWEAVIDIGKILYPDDNDDEGLLIDEENNSRAYKMSTYNPESKWDYWRIGGRWGGYFTRKADSDGTSFLLPEKGWDSPDKFGFSSADAAPKGLLDLAAMREKAADEAVRALPGIPRPGRPSARGAAVARVRGQHLRGQRLHDRPGPAGVPGAASRACCPGHRFRLERGRRRAVRGEPERLR